jgi:hypothetical protein
MEPILGALGSTLGGLFNFLGAARQAEAVEEVARSRERSTKSLVDAAIAQAGEMRRAQEAWASTARDTSFWEQATQRTRIYYNYQASRSGQAALFLLAGAGLVGVVLWRMSRETV